MLCLMIATWLTAPEKAPGMLQRLLQYPTRGTEVVYKFWTPEPGPPPLVASVCDDRTLPKSSVLWSAQLTFSLG